jgi:hypothetical protein
MHIALHKQPIHRLFYLRSNNSVIRYNLWLLTEMAFKYFRFYVVYVFESRKTP